MKRNRWLYLSLLLIAMTLLSGACNREATGAVSGTPSANGTGTPDATGVAGATATPAVNYSPRTLPVREITFRVRVPANTPSNDTVYVIVLPFNDGWTQHVALTRESGNVWSGVVSLPIDSMVRYAYDRWPDENDFVNTRTTREAADEVIEVDSRYMHLTSDVSVVEDVVDTWRDRPAPSPSGIITGVVLDATPGEPVMDANV
ncbi:MAG: hypothetical protein O2854_07875, partial [Chloroflexi bacterium]|nr:hypothetical protein [Chloroflexota bacterium]